MLANDCLSFHLQRLLMTRHGGHGSWGRAVRDNDTIKHGSVQTSLEVVALSSFFPMTSVHSKREETDNNSSYTKFFTE